MRVLVTLLLSICAFSFPASPTDPLPGPIPARLLSVTDGDTFVVVARTWINQETTVTVRPRGFDSAEIRGRCPAERALANAARRALKRMLEASTGILLHDIEPDKYGGRVSARVTLEPGARDLTALMLEAGRRDGHSRPYEGGRRPSWCDGSF